MNSQLTFPRIAGAAARTHAEMMPVLYDPQASGPQEHYFMIRGDGHIANTTLWLPGTIGGEYIKAFGHYHTTDFIETYTVLHGTGVLVLQKRRVDHTQSFVNNTIETFAAVRLRAGESISIPPFWGHGMVNIGDTWLITVDDSPIVLPQTLNEHERSNESSLPSHADYESIKTQKGFGYYVLKAQDGTDMPISFVKNNTYTELPIPRFFDNVNLFAEFISNTK